MTQDYSKDPRVYFAAEQTFLAWIRTGLYTFILMSLRLRFRLQFAA